MKFSAFTLLAACSLGLVLGQFITLPRPAVAVAQAQATPAARPPDDGKLRIIVFGAHPDDAEYRGAGVAMKWAKAGHHVKFVSATNGDIGHQEMAGGPLALRRRKEVRRSPPPRRRHRSARHPRRRDSARPWRTAARSPA